MLRGYLLLDARLGQTVAQAREPLLGQIRLAWWRERIDALRSAGTEGEPLLEEIDASWGAHAPELVALIDGWEELFGDGPLSPETIGAFARARAAPLATLARKSDRGDLAARVACAAERWALVDFAWRTRDHSEREAALDLARSRVDRGRLPRMLGGVRLLGQLASHALATGRPLFADRRAALVAMRVGLIGR